MSAQNAKVPSEAPRPDATRRWRWLAAALGGFLTLAVLYGAYWAQVLRHHQSTDDAYVGGNVVQITPQISGTVVAIGADDTQFVKAGEALVRLDQADARWRSIRRRRSSRARCATCATSSPPARSSR